MNLLLVLILLALFADVLSGEEHRATILHPGKEAYFDSLGDFPPSPISPQVLISATTFPESLGAVVEILVDGEVVGRSGGVPAKLSLPFLPKGDHTLRVQMRSAAEENGPIIGLAEEIPIHLDEESDHNVERLRNLGWTEDEDSEKMAEILAAPSTPPLVNVAMGKAARQSSDEGAETGAQLAVDGESTIMQQAPLTVAQTQNSLHPWWEVDFDRSFDVQVVDVYRAAVLRAPHEYPEAVPGDSLRLLQGQLVADNGRVVAAHMWHEEGDAMLTWRLKEPVLARKLRLFLDDSVPRTLALAEVEVFATVEDWQCEDTCDHGTCIDGRCICDTDYTGAHCSVSIFSRWRYLPPPDDWVSVPDPTPSSPLYHSLLNDIFKTQHPATCSSDTADVYFYPNAGLASTLNYVSGLLSMSINRGKAMTTTHRMAWCYTDSSCPDRDFSCYLQPWSNCTDRIPPPPNHLALSSVQPFGVPYDFDQHFYHRPRKYLPLGVFWWRVAMIETIVRPKQSEMDKIRMIKRQLGLEGKKYIGLHFRQGDSCHTSWRTGKCLGSEHHLEEVAMVAERYGIEDVFVATDDAELPTRLQELGDKMGLRFVTYSGFDRTELSASTDWIEKRLEGNELPQADLARFTLVDMFILAESHVLIGQFQSNLSRLSYALNAARQRRLPPFVSLDGPWCANWRMCCNLRFGGAADIC